MTYFHVNYSNRKGQLKVQEMAFVLVAIMIFFAIVAIFYISVRFNSLENRVIDQRSEEAKETIRKLAYTPEFAWTSGDCEGCVDMDKALLLKDQSRKYYQNLWNLDYLSIEVLYPKREGECTKSSYPNCKSLVIINKTSNFGTVEGSFVSVCRQEFSQRGYARCELGIIYAAGEGIK